MLARALSCAVVGLDSALVEVEVDLSQGLPAFTIVGLPDMAVNEAKERVRAAIRNSGLHFPMRRITVNLAPADLRKEGPSYDLPMAVALLTASEQLALEPAQHLFLGELGLDGALRHTTGILPMVALARERAIPTVYVPAVNALEAALIREVEVIPLQTLAELVAHLRGEVAIAPAPSADEVLDLAPPAYATDFAEVRGQEHVKRALEVAAAGGHNVLLAGPPGAGKTLLARALPSILPALDLQEALEATKIYSVAGLLPPETPLIRQRPFRAPHYTISHAGLVGGGRWPRPGEISLAHRGVLFLDELPEFGQSGLEVLRQPLEDGHVVISRAQGSVTFPAKFMLVGAMNPCPCGYHGDPTRECGCSPGAVARYQKRLSGPLLDRIDVHVEVPRVAYDKLAGPTQGEPSAAIRARVQAARVRQAARLAGSGLLCNAEMGPKGVRASCVVAEEAQGLLKAAMARLQLSARAHHRVLKLAHTLADLAASERISAPHLVEAVQYRPRSHTPSAMTASALSPCYHPAHCHERQAAGDADARAARPRRAPLAPYHALPEYLTRFGKRTVSIPYAPILAALVPVDHGRVRRDFPCLLSFKWAPQARTGLDSPDTGAYTNVTLSVTASRYLRQETRYEVRGCSSLLDLGTADGDRVPGPPGPRQHRSQGGDMRA